MHTCVSEGRARREKLHAGLMSRFARGKACDLEGGPAPLAEYTNGTSFYFDLEKRTCRRVAFPVGILTPDWLAHADYLGTDTVNSRPCMFLEVSIRIQRHNVT